MKSVLWGSIFLAYGILKIILVTAMFVIPPKLRDYLATIEGVRYLITTDKTLAGKMYEYVLLFFAVFSVIHGLAILSVFPDRVHTFIEHKALQYTIYFGLGAWLMIFYGLVLYTDVPITKNEKYKKEYKVYCYLGGLSFLLVPVLWELITLSYPFLQRLKEETQLIYMTLMMLTAIVGVFLAYVAARKLRKHLQDNAIKKAPLLTGTPEALQVKYIRRTTGAPGSPPPAPSAGHGRCSGSHCTVPPS